MPASDAPDTPAQTMTSFLPNGTASTVETPVAAPVVRKPRKPENTYLASLMHQYEADRPEQAAAEKKAKAADPGDEQPDDDEAPVESPSGVDGEGQAGAGKPAPAALPAFLAKKAVKLGLDPVALGASYSVEDAAEILDEMLAARLAPKPEAKPADEEGDDPIQSKYEAVRKKLAEDEFDPSIVALADSFAEARKEDRKTIAALRATLDQVVAHQREFSQQTVVSEADKAFIALNHPLLGTGTVQQIANDPDALEMRNSVLRRAEGLKKSMPGSTMGERIAEAARRLLKIGPSQKPAPKQAVQDDAEDEDPVVAKWNRSTLAKPGRREAAEEGEGEEAAVRAIARMQKEFGWR